MEERKIVRKLEEILKVEEQEIPKALFRFKKETEDLEEKIK